MRTFAAVAAAVALALTVAAPAAAFETQAEYAILLDYDTGAVLFEKRPDDLMAPASMSKIMTAYMVFEALRDGRVSLEDELPVSETAWRKGGSKMFVEVGKRVGVEDLLRGIIVQSGNDACIVVAEGLAGSEEAFARAMTERARSLGMTRSTFVNATGWPEPNQMMTARELAILARAMISEFPEFYHYYSEKTFTFNEIKQGSRNPLLYKEIGADGLKTGHTEESGYGLTASVKRGDRRLVMVVNGLESVRARSEESEKLVEWGFREFGNYALFEAGEPVDEVAVWLGDRGTVPVVLRDDLTVTLPRAARQKMTVKVVYDGPVPAPLKKGTEVATLVVEAPDTLPIERPLYALDPVGQLDFLGRITSAAGYLLWGPSQP